MIVNQKDFYKPFNTSLLKIAIRCNGGIILIGRANENQPWEYLSEFEEWHKFSDPTKMEDPKVYVSTNAAVKKLNQIRSQYPKWNVLLLLWIHPDYDVPNQTYEKMTGIQYPGTVKN